MNRYINILTAIVTMAFISGNAHANPRNMRDRVKQGARSGQLTKDELGSLKQQRETNRDEMKQKREEMKQKLQNLKKTTAPNTPATPPTTTTPQP